MISYIFRIILLIIVFLFVKKLFLSLFRIGRQTSRRVPRDSGQDRTMIKTDQVEKDPVCGMFVAREAAVVLETNGDAHYFCSEQCRDKFLEESKS